MCGTEAMSPRSCWRRSARRSFVSETRGAFHRLWQRFRWENGRPTRASMCFKRRPVVSPVSSYQVHVFPQLCDSQSILQTLADLNADPTITGIAIHTRLSTRFSELTAALAPEKDVDGVQPLHLGRFLTNKRIWRHPRGADIVQLLKRAGTSLVGTRVICIGNASGFAGILTWLCLHENATVSAWRAHHHLAYRHAAAAVTCSSSIPTICPPWMVWL